MPCELVYDKFDQDGRIYHHCQFCHFSTPRHLSPKYFTSCPAYVTSQCEKRTTIKLRFLSLVFPPDLCSKKEKKQRSVHSAERLPTQALNICFANFAISFAPDSYRDCVKSVYAQEELHISCMGNFGARSGTFISQTAIWKLPTANCKTAN